VTPRILLRCRWLWAERAPDVRAGGKAMQPFPPAAWTACTPRRADILRLMSNEIAPLTAGPVFPMTGNPTLVAVTTLIDQQIRVLPDIRMRKRPAIAPD
jgi:hypothetical protein